MAAYEALTQRTSLERRPRPNRRQHLPLRLTGIPGAAAGLAQSPPKMLSLKTPHCLQANGEEHIKELAYNSLIIKPSIDRRQQSIYAFRCRS